MADLANSREGAGHAADAVGEGAISTSLLTDCTKRETHQEVKTVTSNLTGELAGGWAEFSSRKLAGDALKVDITAEEGVSDTAEKPEHLSQALTSAQWNSVDSMSRSLPIHGWANFSPVASSHAKDTSTWAQNIPDNSGEHPFIITSNGTTECESPVVAQDGDTSPGWHSFSLGGESAKSTAPWPQTAQSVRHSECSHNTTSHLTPGVCRSDKPYQTASPQHCHCHPCATVFTHCFASSQKNAVTGSAGTKCNGGADCQLVATECTRDWQCLKDDSFANMLWTWAQTSLHHPPPSSCQARLTSVLCTDEVKTGQAVSGLRVVPLGEERFDWTRPNQRRRSMSPDVVPNLFRPRKESLVDVDFDHDRAASGLAVLSVVELRKMCDEMTSKFSRLSDELLTNLQSRDVLAGQMEAKNRFVSALLRVQQLRHAQDLNGVSSGEPGRGRQWVWSQKKRDDEASVMYLQAVIPYKIPEGLKWRTATLIQLTKVLKAMVDGSSTVPKLMSEYLQSEFLSSPVTDSPSPDKSSVLPTLSV